MTLASQVTNYWKFDENSGTTAADEVGSGNLTGLSGTWPDGILGASGFHSDGTLVNTAENMVGFTNGFTLNYWVKRTAAESGDGIILTNYNATSNGYWWDKLLGNSWQCMAIDDTSTKTSNSHALTTNQWYMFTVTRSASEMKIYKDGSWVQDVALSNFDFDKAETIDFFNVFFGDFIEQTIVDEMGWFDGILSAGDISDLWNSGAGLAYPFVLNTDVPISAALALSTTAKEPTIITQIPIGALALSLTAKDPVIPMLKDVEIIGALALSLSQPAPTIAISVNKVVGISAALALTLSPLSPIISTERNPNIGTKSTKEIAKINIPEGIGDIQNLIPEGINGVISTVLSKERVGLEM